MRNLIKADMGRILKHPLLYLGMLFVIVSSTGHLGAKLAEEVNSTAAGIAESFHAALNGEAYIKIILAFVIFFVIFAYEVPSKSMQCVLGHGLSRDKLVIAKLIEVAILVSVFYLLATGLALLLLSDSDLGTSARLRANLMLYIWLTALRIFGYIAFSAMVLYLANSTAAGIVAVVVFTTVVQMVFAMIDAYGNLSISDYTFDGLLNRGYTVVEAGGFAWQLILAILYVVAATGVTIAFFRRKEFDF